MQCYIDTDFIIVILPTTTQSRPLETLKKAFEKIVRKG